MDEPKIRLQLILLQRVVSDGFDRRPANEPSPATKPRFQHLEKRPAAFWKSSKEDLERKVRARKRLIVANGTSERPDTVMTMAGV